MDSTTNTPSATPISSTATPIPILTSTKDPYILNVTFGTYIIILFSATIIVLIWAFFIFFFFSRGGRRTQFPNLHSRSRHRTSSSSFSSETTNASFKSDLPPHYETAIDSKQFPSVIILDPKMLMEDDPPTYQDVVIIK